MGMSGNRTRSAIDLFRCHGWPRPLKGSMEEHGSDRTLSDAHRRDDRALRPRVRSRPANQANDLNPDRATARRVVARYQQHGVAERGARGSLAELDACPLDVRQVWHSVSCDLSSDSISSVPASSSRCATRAAARKSLANPGPVVLASTVILGNRKNERGVGKGLGQR